MKLTKIALSAVVALGLSSSAFAVDFGGVNNVKVSGQTKLYYETIDNGNSDLFSQASASGQAALKLGVTGKFGKAMGFGLTTYAIDTLGLENNLVSGTRVGKAGAEGAEFLNTQWWFGEAYITYKMGNTLAKIGRQTLNTPLAFTENWNLTPNTFDAAVLINSDIPKTTLIAAYVGRGNGTYGSVVNFDGEFNTFVADGAYALGVLNKSIPNVPVNLWYYNVQDVADAAWIDANAKFGMVSVKAIYATMMPKAAGANDTDAYALKVSAKAANVKVCLAYSSVSDGALPVANTATGFKKTKLPTAGVYADGTVVAQPDTDSFKIKASTKVAGFGLTAQYISADIDNGSDRIGTDAEFDLILSKKVADINVKALYINRDFEVNQGAADADHIRIIASYSF